MQIRALASVAFAAVFVSACGTPPVSVPRAEVRREVKAVAADIQGIKYSDTSNLAARGSGEGASKGAQQGAAVGLRGGNLLAILIMTPIAAAVGSASGAANAKPEDVVDEARANLRAAMQETDFTELLRAKLAASGAAGEVKVTSVTGGSASAMAAAGRPETAAEHVITLEYQIGIIADGLVNPDIGLFSIVKGQLIARERRQVLHTNTWGYCSERKNFVEVSAQNGAALRQELDKAATVMAEAILYDFFVATEPRSVSTPPGCMDYANLPSGIGKRRDVSPSANFPAEMVAPRQQ